MFYSAIAELPFFEHYKKDLKSLIEELEFENGQGNGLLPSSDTSRINISLSPDNFTDEEKRCKC
jgi:hypothetical protein